MHLPYVSTPFQPANDEKAIHENILARRGPSGLVPLVLTHLHAPLLVDGFNGHAKAVRTRNSLQPTIRELTFTRVAALLQCWYEWDIHKPIDVEAGLSAEAMDVVKKGEEALSESFTAEQLAVIKYTDAMTLSIRVPDEIWNGVKKYFTVKELVELTASVAIFNSVCRFVTALNVGERNDPL